MKNPTLYMTDYQKQLFHEAMMKYASVYEPRQETNFLEHNFMYTGISIKAVPFPSMEERQYPEKTWRHVKIATLEEIRIGKIKKLKESDYAISCITKTPFQCIQNMVHFQQLRAQEELKNKKSVSI